MRNVRETKNRRIFLFVTSKCMRSCDYCFMKGVNYCREMPPEIRKAALDLAESHLYESVTIIGGEPLLYSDILTCIDEVNARNRRCSISTAGTRNKQLLNEILKRPLDDITVSLDSADEVTNDILRGKGAFKTAVETIETIVKANVSVRVTATVNKLNKDYIPELIEFLQDKGVFQVDFHLMSYNGEAKNHQDIGLSPEEWFTLRNEIDNMNLANIAISLPYIWVEKNSPLVDKYYRHCEMCNNDRLSIMPNGDCYTCTLAIGEELPRGNIVNGIPCALLQKDIFNGDNVCRCERNIGTDVSDKYAYICRFIKQKKV